MGDYSGKEIIINFLSVVFGVLTILMAAYLLFFPFYDIAAQFMNFHEHESINSGSKSNDLIIELVFLIWIFISGFIGGIACAKISKRKNYAHIIITGVVTILLIVLLDLFEITDGFTNYKIKFSLSVFLGCFLGGFIILKKRKKTLIKKDNFSSPPDTAAQ